MKIKQLTLGLYATNCYIVYDEATRDSVVIDPGYTPEVISQELEQLQLQKNPYISVRIGVPADAANVGGLNLFGEKFGDFAQTLTLRLGYHMP